MLRTTNENESGREQASVPDAGLPASQPDHEEAGVFPPAVRTVCCPRCDYDLRGLIDSWRDSCPMHATCSECGLEFECADVLSLERLPPAWFFEHGTRFSLKRLFGTLARSAWPIGFWRSVRLEYPLQRGRLIFVMLFVVLLMQIAVTGLACVRIYHMTAEVLRWRGAWWGPGGQFTANEPTMMEVYWSAKDEFLLAAIWPYSVKVGRWREPNLGGEFFELLAVAIVLMPLTFLLLGESMRRCRVRNVHLLRGFAYSLPLPAILVVGGILLHVLRREEMIVKWMVVGTLLWLAVYWFFFTWRYLRLPHAWGVALAMVTISVLAGAVVQVGFFAWRNGVF